ncbi:MAG: thiamine diphosphokinase [Armatimonadetes bacterium]|nr:thiamine diphosphokinase [Armatimonadota bacterium]
MSCRAPRSGRLAVVIANGHAPSIQDAAARLRRADLLICANGGLRIARRVGVPPQIVIGDFDSAPAGLLRWAQAHDARLIRHPARKDKSDTELALDAAIEGGASEVEFLGVLGGNVDHSLANVALLVQAEAKGIRARIVDGEQQLFLARRKTAVPGRRGDIVSLIPMTPTVTGITLTGFRYPLKNATARQGSTRTISNVIDRSPATIRFKRGRLLVVVTHH